MTAKCKPRTAINNKSICIHILNVCTYMQKMNLLQQIALACSTTAKSANEVNRLVLTIEGTMPATTAKTTMTIITTMTTTTQKCDHLNSAEIYAELMRNCNFYLPCYCSQCISNQYAPQMPYIYTAFTKYSNVHLWGSMPIYMLSQKSVIKTGL